MPVEQVVAEIEAVTQEDVLRVAQRLIVPQGLYLSVIGPYEDEDLFADLIERLTIYEAGPRISSCGIRRIVDTIRLFVFYSWLLAGI